MNALKKTTLLAATLCFIVVGLGAYVRLSDAGLGCPDWPGCYGHIGVPEKAEHIEIANSKFPDTPVEAAKAWKEMIHRYLASFLGLLIVAIAFISYRLRIHRIISSLLLAVVVFQGVLGMWTVTLLLKPAIVSAHLLGGITTLALLLTLYYKLSPISTKLVIPYSSRTNLLRTTAIICLVGLIAQIALGGWVSSNYAALACTDFPTCNGSYNPNVSYEHAFTIWRELGFTAEGEALSSQTLVAIHWLHRVGALILTVLMVGLASLLCNKNRTWSIIIVTLLAVQIILGIANVLADLPITLAVAHNLGAAAIMVAILMLNFSIKKVEFKPRVFG